MSISDFIKEKKIKTLIDELCPLPSNAEYPIIVKAESKSSPVTGMALSYALSFILKANTQNFIYRKFPFERSIKIIENIFKKDIFVDSEILKMIDKIREIHNEFKETSLKDFYKTRILSDEILKHCVVMAKTDWLLKVDSLDLLPDIFDVDNRIVNDVMNMINIIPVEWFYKKDIVMFPDFGTASTMVGGADTDILADNILLDIRTVSSAKLKKEYWHHLVTLMILSDLQKEIFGEKELPDVEFIGILFARAGVIDFWQVEKNTDNYEQLKEEMFEYIIKHYMPKLNDREFELTGISKNMFVKHLLKTLKENMYKENRTKLSM